LKAFYTSFVTTYCQGKQTLFGACTTATSIDTIWTGACYSFTELQLKAYPTIYIILANDITLSLDPLDYLVSNSAGFRCLDILSHNNPDVGGLLLGYRFMQKYYIIFDREQKQIGFAEASNCTGAKYQLIYMGGDWQHGTISTKLSNPFKVKVIDIAVNKPAANVTINFKITKGNGRLTNAQPITDNKGMAQTYLLLGEKPSLHVVTASLDLALNSPLSFNAIGEKSVVYIVLGVLTLVGLSAVLGIVLVIQRQLERQRLNSMSHLMFYDTRPIELKQSE